MTMEKERCICCGSYMKYIYERTIDDGIEFTMSGGYGALHHDGSIMKAFICISCIDEKIKDNLLKVIGNIFE